MALILFAPVSLAGCSGGQTAAVAPPVAVAPTPTPSPTPPPAPTPTPTPAPPVTDVMLVLGISNATGYQLDKTHSYVTDAEVQSWDGVDLVPYVPNTVTGLQWGEKNGSWAAELSYAQAYRTANPGRRLVIIRFTAPATQMAPAPPDKNQDWNTASTGELFDRSGAAYLAALGAIRARYGEPRIRLVWLQFGEGDLASDTAPQYRANFTSFIDGLRAAGGRFAIPAATPIAVGRVGSQVLALFPQTTPIVRDAQKMVADLDRGGPSVLLNLDDLNFDSDNLHLSKTGQLSLGSRLWEIDQGRYIEP